MVVRVWCAMGLAGCAWLAVGCGESGSTDGTAATAAGTGGMSGAGDGDGTGGAGVGTGGDGGGGQTDAGAMHDAGATDSGVDAPDACVDCADDDARSEKRGAGYNFCDWGLSGGKADLDLLATGDTPGGGMTWYYNWGPSPADCVKDAVGPGRALQFVPMAWGLHDGGAACAAGGPCFTDGLDEAAFSARMPDGARYLLGFNEPNFAHQSGLTPSTAARAWRHLESVSGARGMALVGPAINYCDTTPGSDHGGSCTEEPAARSVDFGDYAETFAAGHRHNAFAWLELFYDECSVQGVAGHDCRIDYQAGHVYSYWGAVWFVDAFKRKAGLLDAEQAHCRDGQENDDEFGVDCGGNDCVACTAWARAQFGKALWLTEFAPSTDDAGSPQTDEQRRQRTLDYLASELPKLEADPFVFRYAWFMPKTDIGSLDHVDLLTEDPPVRRTEVGERYLDFPH